MNREELDKYIVQRDQVSAALKADPSNKELEGLLKGLNELIELTRSAISTTPAASSSSSSTPTPSSSTYNPYIPQPKSGAVVEYTAGTEVMAKYEDGQWYPARITALSGSSTNRAYTVTFKSYDTTSTLPPASIKPLTASAKRKEAEDTERARKKKRNDKKLEVRAAKAKEQATKQASWQKFTKKAGKKGIDIAGIEGRSIFKSPDNPYGRVGVTGSGKAMTDYGQRVKHVYQDGEQEE